jgi:hypothetical protein
LQKDGRKLVFMLDEFELMSQNPALDPDFFAGLRALATRYMTVFVTASKQPLLDLTYNNTSVLSSPFFNIFATIRLKLFEPGATRDFIRHMTHHRPFDFTDATLDAIIDLGGTQPLLLQIASYHAYELRQTNDDPLDSDDHAELKRRFQVEADEHFAYYWRNLTEVDQLALATLPSATEADSLRSLEQQCLIARRADDDGYDHFSTAFGEFAQAQPINGWLRSGSVLADANRRQMFLNGHALDLTELQFKLLLHLIQGGGQVVESAALEEALWGDEYIDDPERLKSVIKGVRRALGDAAGQLDNVRGVGYRWQT